jgi:hypothetical protein
MCLVAWLGHGAWAFTIDTGQPDLALRWDHSLRYSLGWRTEKVDAAFGNDPTYDETEHRFGRGRLMTNRLDLLSELDLTWQRRLGARISAAAWADAAYSGSARTAPGAIDSSGTGAGPFVPYAQIGNYANNRYSGYTRRFTHAGAEFLDAFVFANLDLGTVPVALRLGQHTVYWGESLFTTFHGIAYSQSPLDGLKAASSPGITAKEVFLPLRQFSATAQLPGNVSMAAQYYFDWKPNRLPEGGTYFGSADLLFSGPDRAFLGFAPGGFPLFMPRGDAVQPQRRHGNWGVSLRWSPPALSGTTFGLYLRRFDEKQPWAPLLRLDPASPLPADYHLAYARGTQLVGVSAVTTLGSVSVGAEISYRRGSALNSTSATVVPPALLDFNGTEGARGNTWHALVNGVYVLPQSALWSTGTVQVELVYSRLHKVTSRPEVYNGIGYACPPGQGIDQGCATRSVWLVQAGFEPQWLQALPGIDVSMPLSLACGLRGNGATLAGGNEGACAWSAGMTLDVRNRTQVTLKVADSHARVQQANGRVTGSNGNAVQNSHGWLSLSLATSF